MIKMRKYIALGYRQIVYIVPSKKETIFYIVAFLD